jgi:hypothetical protein
MDREKRQAEIEEWRSKLKGKEYIYIKKNPLEHTAQLDKLHVEFIFYITSYKHFY